MGKSPAPTIHPAPTETASSATQFVPVDSGSKTGDIASGFKAHQAPYIVYNPVLVALSSGTKLGPYMVTAPIGAGGMGEVYRATDTKLGRDVALKVLPEAFAADEQRMQRFQREAQVLASLNHPNIATIHGLEESGMTRALVMELVEGPTLADHIAQGAVPIAEALPIAKQIAEALEYAHERGIIHRDLKPANIKLTADGKVKVLDFGLAKALAEESSLQDISNSPTLTMAATKAGVILGTAAYMSPEQAKGKPMDRRTDIWAFGVVLYEMLTGRQMYSGETASETLARVIEREPDFSALPAATPRRLVEMLRRCLMKDPRQRLQAIGEARIALDDTATSPGAVTEALPAVRVAAWRARLPWGVAGMMALAALLSLVGLWRANQPAPRVVKRFVVSLPPSTMLYAGITNSIAVSPDGQYFVYRASQASGGWRLFLRSASELDAVPITGSEDALNPFFSPDGKWVGFFAGGKLKKVALSGGAPLTICDAPEGRGASWGPDDTIVFGLPGTQGLRRVSAGGGKPEELTRVDPSQKEASHRWPEFLPGGQAVLFSILGFSADWDTARLAVLSLKTGQRRVLVEGGTNPHYSPTGHILYVRSGTLLAVPFDLARLEVTGSPVPALEGVFMNRASGNAEAVLSAEGTLLYLAGFGTEEPRELVWVDRRGMARPVGLTPAAFEQPSLSPDGKRIAVHILPPSDDIWVSDLARGTLTRLTFQPGEDESPVWSADSKRVVFSSTTSNEPRAVLWKNADGSGTEEKLATTGFHVHVGSFSPDGSLIAYTNYETETRGDIWLLPLTGDRKPRPFLQTPFNERDPKISPDGRWLAYTSDETGRDEVYVQALAGPGGKYQVSTEGGFGALWARNGRELFYRNDNKVMAVSIATQMGFSASQPRLLFEGPYEIHPRREGIWDVAPDGQRFLMVKATGRESPQSQLRVVLNFFDDLRNRAPAGGNK